MTALPDERVLVDRHELVEMLRRSLVSGKHGLSGVPNMVRLVLSEQAWEAREVVPIEKVVRFKSFAKFVTDPPLEGLGTDLDTLKRLCGDDIEAQALIDQATQREHGGDRKSEDFNVANSNVDRMQGRPNGTTRGQALRRLRKSRPDLLEQVVAGDISPHAAMVEAGFRPKTLTVPASEPERIASTLVRHLNCEQIATVVALLSTHLESPSHQSRKEVTP